MAHAIYSPSKLPRIIACPASAQAVDESVSQSEYASEGEKLHLAVSESLDQGDSQLTRYIREKFKLTDDQADVVDDCLSYAWSLKVTYGAEDAYELIENKVSMVGYAQALKCEELAEVEGTLDYAFIIPSRQTAIIVDWKFGAGVHVSADTPQLKAYALSVLKSPKRLMSFKSIDLVILQPRIDVEPDIRHFTPEALYEWASEILAPALIATRAKHPVYRPSTNTCRWCPIKATCRARRVAAVEIAKQVFTVHGTLPTPDEQEMAQLLDKAASLTAYLDDIKGYAINRIQNGFSFPGYKLVAGRSNRQWKDEDKAKEWLKVIGLKDDDLYTKKFVSPPQAEKKVGKQWKAAEEFINLYEKKGGAPTLVRETDPRDPLKFASAAEKFAEFDKPLID